MVKKKAGRRLRAQRRVAAAGADAALVTSPANVRYLTGLVSSNAAVLVPADGPAVLATDSRYAGAAERDCGGIELLISHSVKRRSRAPRPSAGCGPWPSRHTR